MNAHTIKVDFDDETTTLDNIVQALSKAGYTVPEHEQLTQ